jgi:hypothetical protein
MDPPRSAPRAPPTTSEVVVRNEFVIGMPHLGPHPLGQSQNLKHLGHLRWQSFQRLAGAAIHLVADSDRRPVYAAFYHVVHAANLAPLE